MLIECRIKRPRTVTLGDQVYRFKMDEHERNVCAVNIEAHIQRLLEIECYYPAEIATDDVPAPVAAPVEPAPEPMGMSNTLGPAMADALAAVEPMDEGEGSESRTDDAIENGIRLEAGEDAAASQDKDPEPEPAPEAEAPATERDALQAQYKELFGKNPRANLSNAKVQQAIDDKLRDSGE